MHKRLVLSFTLSLFIIVSLAQVSAEDIVFEKKEIDFGTVIIEHGIVSATYSFTNKSENEFVISGIDAACGCTNPRSSKKKYAPGESGTITAEFNPKGMTGDVHKWIYVKGNYNDATQIDLGFNAILKSTLTRDARSYPGEFGYLVVDKINVGYGIIKGKKIQYDSVLLKNEGYHAITVKSARNLPSWITIENLPLNINSGTTKHLQLKINTTDLDTVGPYVGTIQLLTNDQFFPKKSINYYATFEMDFSKMKRRERKKAPKFEVDTKTVDLGNMKSGELKSEAFTITNTGKNPLLIKRVESDCTCAILNDLKTRIGAGESITVRAQLDTLFKQGRQSKTITIYTNDPLNPKVKIVVTALVK
ncbi:MAG: DUF1573 domain-containing protein [Bacteroidia bacterium]|nr:DUF1573 domain-containing protein [Bacteroidia bacterium]